MGAFEQLYETLSDEILHYLTTLPCDVGRASDLVQETFLQMHRSRHTYLPGRPVRPWAFAIARYVCLEDLPATARNAGIG